MPVSIQLMIVSRPVVTGPGGMFSLKSKTASRVNTWAIETKSFESTNLK